MNLPITAPGVLTFDNQPGAEPLPPRPAAWVDDAPSPHAARPMTAVEAGTLRTTAQVAAALNRPARSILAVARRKGIKPAMVIGGTSMWDSSQLPDLQPQPRGWPKGKARGAKP